MPWMMVNSVRAVFETQRTYSGEDVAPERPFGREGCSESRRAYLRDPVRSQDVGIAETLTPMTTVLTTPRDSLLDHIQTYGVGDFTVSDRVRRIIEEFEPGRHYFFRDNIVRRDGSPWPEQYWSFKAGPAAIVQALIVEQSERLAWVVSPLAAQLDYKRSLQFDVGRTRTTLTVTIDQAVDVASGLTLDREAFVGRHVVKEYVYRERRPVFLSDALHAALKREKVTGFKFGKVKTAERTVPPYGASEGTGRVE